jgi:hypothetical protein
MKSTLLLLLSLIPFATHASESILAYRHLKTDYSVYEQRALSKELDDKILRKTPLNTARYFSDTKVPPATHWRSLEDLQIRFEEIRDERFLTTPDDPDFLRRISWLYPKDGCFTRAALFNRSAFRKFIPIPKKVFAFGNLRVKTPNSLRGVVGWWYHVAPIVQVGDAKYVLDPSIEATRPLELREWLERMGTPEKIKVSICDTGTYSPTDNCDKETDGLELRAEKTAKHYLALEKRELAKLRRNYEKELGERPPWEE